MGLIASWLCVSGWGRLVGLWIGVLDRVADRRLNQFGRSEVTGGRVRVEVMQFILFCFVADLTVAPSFGGCGYFGSGILALWRCY